MSVSLYLHMGGSFDPEVEEDGETESREAELELRPTLNSGMSGS